MGVELEQMGIVYRCVQKSKILPNKLKGLKQFGVILIENTILTLVGLRLHFFALLYRIQYCIIIVHNAICCPPENS